MSDPSLPLTEKATVWSKIDKYEPALKIIAYDQMKPSLSRQLARHQLGQTYSVDDLFPEPPGMEQYRREFAIAQQRAREAREAAAERDAMERR